MISRTDADYAVKRFLSKLETPELEFLVINDKTIEKAFGWIYFYNSKKFLETGNIIYRLAGNGPIVVDKETGAIIPLGTNKPVATLIEEYEKNWKGTP